MNQFASEILLLSSLFRSKEFVAAVIGALLGGLITGLFSWLTQKQAAKDQRRRDRETERQTLKGTLQAIEAEIEAFKLNFLDGFDQVFTAPDAQTPDAHLPKVASLRQNLSSVFDSNAAVLGRIADAQLRRKIVATYAKLKAIVDVINYYAERREFWENVRYQQEVIGANELRAEAETWAGNVRRSAPELETDIADLLGHIRKYLNSLEHFAPLSREPMLRN